MGILTQIRTREDLEYLAADLEDLRSSLYKLKTGIKPPEIIRLGFEQAQNKEEYLNNLAHEIHSARVMEITVANYIQDSSLKKVSTWIKENVGENVVLNIKIEPEIMAGAKISFNGKFYDFSLKEKLAEVIKSISF